MPTAIEAIAGAPRSGPTKGTDDVSTPAGLTAASDLSSGGTGKSSVPSDVQALGLLDQDLDNIVSREFLDTQSLKRTMTFRQRMSLFRMRARDPMFDTKRQEQFQRNRTVDIINNSRARSVVVSRIRNSGDPNDRAFIELMEAEAVKRMAARRTQERNETLFLEQLDSEDSMLTNAGLAPRTKPEKRARLLELQGDKSKRADALDELGKLQRLNDAGSVTPEILKRGGRGDLVLQLEEMQKNKAASETDENPFGDTLPDQVESLNGLWEDFRDLNSVKRMVLVEKFDEFGDSQGSIERPISVAFGGIDGERAARDLFFDDLLARNPTMSEAIGFVRSGARGGGAGQKRSNEDSVTDSLLERLESKLDGAGSEDN